MLELLRSYTLFVLHPFRTQEYFAGKSHGQAVYWPYGTPPRMLSLWESIGISWIFVIINSLIGLSLFLISHEFLETYYQAAGEIFDAFPEARFLSQKNAFYWIFYVGVIVIFPLTTFLGLWVWRTMILFSCRCFGIHGELERKSDEVLVGYLSAYMALPIPVFGNLIKTLLGLIALYAGLTRQFKMSGLQACITLVMPIMLVLFLGVFFTMLFSILLGLLSF